MVKELHLSLEYSDIHELPVHTDPSNEDSICVKRKIHILDHPKQFIEVLCARLVISQSLTGNNITAGPNQ